MDRVHSLIDELNESKAADHTKDFAILQFAIICTESLDNFDEAIIEGRFLDNTVNSPFIVKV